MTSASDGTKTVYVLNQGAFASHVSYCWSVLIVHFIERNNMFAFEVK